MCGEGKGRGICPGGTCLWLTCSVASFPGSWEHTASSTITLSPPGTLGPLYSRWRGWISLFDGVARVFSWISGMRDSSSFGVSLVTRGKGSIVPTPGRRASPDEPVPATSRVARITSRTKLLYANTTLPTPPQALRRVSRIILFPHESPVRGHPITISTSPVLTFTPVPRGSG